MSDATVPVQNPATTDSSLDAEQLTVSAVVVKRERIQLGGAAATEIARVENSTPGGSDMGVVVRNIPSGTQTVAGSGTFTVDSELPAAAALSDTTANPTAPIIGAGEMLWNPQTSQWERRVQIAEQTILASGARTTTQTQADQANRGYRGIAVVLDVTTAGTGDITLKIQGKDATSGKYVDLLAGTNVTTISTNVYRVYPGLLAAVNAIANDTLWRTWRVLVTANNGNTITYSVGAVLLP